MNSLALLSTEAGSVELLEMCNIIDGFVCLKNILGPIRAIDFKYKLVLSLKCEIFNCSPRTSIRFDFCKTEIWPLKNAPNRSYIINYGRISVVTERRSRSPDVLVRLQVVPRVRDQRSLSFLWGR
jgi:hypothetical protein